MKRHTKRCRGVMAGWLPVSYLGPDDSQSVLDMEVRCCRTCGTWLPLGQSDEGAVAIEVRAAEIAARVAHPLAGEREPVEMSADETAGWFDAAADNRWNLTRDGEHAGYLARVIYGHDREDRRRDAAAYPVDACAETYAAERGRR
jgi:hypothetical protein